MRMLLQRAARESIGDARSKGRRALREAAAGRGWARAREGGEGAGGREAVAHPPSSRLARPRPEAVMLITAPPATPSMYCPKRKGWKAEAITPHAKSWTPTRSVPPPRRQGGRCAGACVRAAQARRR